MATKKEYCRLESVEVDVLLSIAIQLPDLLSLHNLIHASPATFRLFGIYGAYITECVSNIDPMSGQVLEMIRTLAHIRSGRLPMLSLDSFITEVILGSKQRSRLPTDYDNLLTALGIDPNSNSVSVRHLLTKMRMHQPKDQGPFVLPSLPKHISPRILRSILAVVWQISRLMPACLHHYLGKAMAIETQHPVDDRFNRDPHSAWDDWRSTLPYRQGRLCPPEGKKYKIRHIGSPSWLEQQRVVLAFWQLRIFYDLKIAGEKEWLNWPVEDIERLKSMHDHSPFFDMGPRGLPLKDEAIYTVFEYLQGFRRDKHISNPFDTDFPTNLPHLGVKLGWPNRRPSPRHRLLLSFQTESVSMFNNLTYDDGTPLYRISFAPFRRLGFAFWDQERMHTLGLDDMPVPYGSAYRARSHRYSFAWWSILSAEDKQALETKREWAASDEMGV